MDLDELATIAERFPLVCRPRPDCPALEERISEVVRLACAADQAADQAADPLTTAAEALNKAALIASDCGLPGLARELCWRHIIHYRDAGRLTTRQAANMLEPAVNLARLHLRAEDARTAWRLLDTLHQAVKTDTDAVIEGKTLPIRGLVGTLDERQELRRWMWGVFLSEGTRALVRLRQWKEALAHAEQNKGIGGHLLDGRQVQIVAACLAGEAPSGLALLDDSTVTEAWETQVAACLTVMCRLVTGHDASQDADRMIVQYLASDPPPGCAVFHARLGLAVVDLAALAAPAKGGLAYARLVGEAVTSQDGYVARDVLAHAGCRERLTRSEEQALSSVVQSAGLGLGAIPNALLTDLLAAIQLCELVINACLDTPANSVEGHAST